LDYENTIELITAVWKQNYSDIFFSYLKLQSFILFVVSAIISKSPFPDQARLVILVFDSSIVYRTLPSPLEMMLTNPLVSPMANYVSLGFKAKAFAFPGI